MELKSGTIHAFEDGIVKSGHFTGSAYKTIILTTGNKLTCFDLDFITGIEIGKEYTFPVEQKGSYTNIVGTVTPVIQTENPKDVYSTPQVISQKIMPKPTVDAEGVPFERPYQIYAGTGKKDEAIRKAVALKAAVEFIVGQLPKVKAEWSVGDVIETAKKFEEYLK